MRSKNPLGLPTIVTTGAENFEVYCPGFATDHNSDGFIDPCLMNTHSHNTFTLTGKKKENRPTKSILCYIFHK